MTTVRRASKGRLLGFSRRHLGPRLSETLLHRNVAISAILSGMLTFTAFRLGWLPALRKVPVGDFAAGVLAFSALGFGAATSAAVLAISLPRGRLYLTMISNGKGAPRVKIKNQGESEKAIPLQEGTSLDNHSYGTAFRSLYGDLIFVFLWTIVTQLAAAVASLLYYAAAGDLNMVDCSHCRRSSLSFALYLFFLVYSIMQMGSLIKGLADYSVQQENYDRSDLGLH